MMVTLCQSAPVSAPRRGCPLVLAAIASLAVAYGFEVYPLLQIGSTLPLSDMAPGLAQAFSQLGGLSLGSRSQAANTPLG